MDEFGYHFFQAVNVGSCLIYSYQAGLETYQGLLLMLTIAFLHLIFSVAHHANKGKIPPAYNTYNAPLK